MVQAAGTCTCATSDPDYHFTGGLELQTDFAQIRDGTSNTIFIGEKQVPTRCFGHAVNPNDPSEVCHDTSIYNPDNLQRSCRFAGPGFGLARSPEESVNDNFGSFHPGVCQFVFGEDAACGCRFRFVAAGIPGEIDRCGLSAISDDEAGEPI